MLKLNQAIRENRLPEFITQEEARGIGPIDKADYETALSSVIRSQHCLVMHREVFLVMLQVFHYVGFQLCVDCWCVFFHSLAPTSFA